MITHTSLHMHPSPHYTLFSQYTHLLSTHYTHTTQFLVLKTHTRTHTVQSSPHTHMQTYFSPQSTTKTLFNPHTHTHTHTHTHVHRYTTHFSVHTHCSALITAHTYAPIHTLHKHCSVHTHTSPHTNTGLPDRSTCQAG